VAHLGEFVALARAHVQRARYNHEPIAPPSPEGNTRLPQELAQIGRGSAVLAGRTSVGEDDFALVSRAALDCIPGARRAVIRALRNGANPSSSGLSGGLLDRTLEDLETLGICERGDATGTDYAFTGLAQGLLAGAGLLPPKCT